MRYLSLLLLLVFINDPILAYDLPDAYQNFDQKDVIPIKLTDQKSGQRSFTLKGQSIHIPSSSVKSGQSKTPQSFHRHFDNGEINATLGGGGLFGQLRIDDERYIITTEKTGMWAVKMPEQANYNSCGTEHKNSNNQTLNLKTLNNTTHQKSTGTVIDLLVVYDQAIANRYPGELLDARVQQYIHVSNQSYANSQLDLRVRLVGLKQAGYNINNANQTLLSHLQKTLAGTTRYHGLLDIPAWREATGADLVIFLRTHDILTRGSCGIAYFPVANGQQFNASYGINVMADGSSSWSICTDQLMVHEIGHNLGAGHHNVPPSHRYLPDAAGFAKLGQYGTIMGSFGTGDPNRFLELNYFSNPNIQCGGNECGVRGHRNNVNVMSQLKGPVSQYVSAQSNAPYPDDLSPSQADNDGDGVTNRNDAFPFDATETVNTDGDPLGDNKDAFPLNLVDWLDYDGDGAGNNVDLDDDNDGHDDRIDDFPFNADEYKDSDKDGVGDNQDAFVTDKLEHTDSDNDGLGDNQDLDSDSDGYRDIDPNKEDILVISVNNNRILRFDAETGRSKGIEVLPEDGQLTFQSDMVYDNHAQRLIYTSESRVISHDLRDPEQPNQTLIYPYHNDKTELNSGFPSALALGPHQKLTVAKTRTTSDAQFQQDYMSEFVLPLMGQAHYKNRKYITVNDETLIDFTYYNDQFYALGTNQPLYKGTINDNQLSVLGASSQNWLKGSYAIMTTDSGDIISTRNGQLYKTDGTTGEFIEYLASTYSIGYENLRGITQTSDKRLLVTDAKANSILQFNMSGEFLGELTTGHGLDGPHKIITVPALKDRFYQNPERVLSPNSGNWFNPDTAGRGFTIAVFNKRLQILWFTYDQDGLPIWYFSADILNGFHYKSDLLKTTQISDNEVEFELVGEIEVNFHNERQATIEWQLNGISGSEDIQWQQFSYEPELENYTGMWTREDAPGWGVGVATVGEKTVITPYLYDGAGEPRWLSSDIAHGTSPLHFNLGLFTSQTLCPGCSGEHSIDFQKVGEMDFDFVDNTWHSDIDWPSPLTGSWELNNTRIVRISDKPRRPR